MKDPLTELIEEAKTKHPELAEADWSVRGPKLLRELDQLRRERDETRGELKRTKEELEVEKAKR